MKNKKYNQSGVTKKVKKAVKVVKVVKEPKYINNLKKKSKKVRVEKEVIKKGMVYKKKDRGNFEGMEIVVPKSYKFLGFCHYCEGIITVKDVMAPTTVIETTGKYLCPICDKSGKIEKLLKKIDIDKEALGSAFERIDDIIPIAIPKEIEDSIKEDDA